MWLLMPDFPRYMITNFLWCIPLGHEAVVYISKQRQQSSSWWRHQMETFSALLVICAGNSPVPGEFHAQRPVTRSFDVFFDLRLNNRWSKQSWCWWFETPSCSLWRQCNDQCTVATQAHIVSRRLLITSDTCMILLCKIKANKGRFINWPV